MVDVAAGVAHSLALLNDGTVVAWGGNSYGECTIPDGLCDVVAIAVGGDPPNNSSYSLALTKDNKLVTWGSRPVVAPLLGMSNVIAIAGGPRHGLAIRTGPRTPVLTVPPTDQYQVAGGAVTFTARGAGLYGVTYQWQTNGVNLAGVTNATLTLTNVQVVHELPYRVVVGNEVGIIASSNASFHLVTAPVILAQTPLPTNQVAVFHKEMTLGVTASAPGQSDGFPLSYQWQWNGTNLPGATSSNYTLLGDSRTEGTYTVMVSNAVGSASASWQVTPTYEGSYVAPGTLAYHLTTNAVAYAEGLPFDQQRRDELPIDHLLANELAINQ